MEETRHTCKAVTSAREEVKEKTHVTRRASARGKSEEKGKTEKQKARSDLTLPARRPLERGKSCGVRKGAVSENVTPGDGQRNGKLPLGALLGKTRTPLAVARNQGRRETVQSDQSSQTLQTSPGDSSVKQAGTCPSAGSGFISGKGSSIQISKEAEEAARKLCFEEEGSEAPLAMEVPNRKRPCEKNRTTEFKMPRTKSLKTATQDTNRPTLLPDRSPMTLTHFKPTVAVSPLQQGVKEVQQFERRATFADFGSQENGLAVPKAALHFPPHNVHSRRVTLGSVLEQRQMGRRQSRGWRPLRPLPVKENSNQLQESPLEKLLREGSFHAERAISPKKAVDYVFSNGASTLSMYGALVDMGMTPSLPWVKQHYRWIVWHLSGCLQGERSALTADSAFLELKDRSVAEKKSKSKLSCLEDWAERGESASLVLLVADIFSTESHSFKMELSDGWSHVMAEMDTGLKTKCDLQKIKVGSLLFVDGLSLQRENSGALQTHLSHNSCVPVAGDTPLGPVTDGSFFVPLSWINAEGGPISTTLLCIHRRYPVLFQHKNEGGASVYLTQKQHQARLEAYANEMDQISSTAKALVLEEETKYFKTVVQGKRRGEPVDPIEYLYAQCFHQQSETEALDATELAKLEKFKLEHEESLESCLMKQIEQLKKDWATVALDVTPRLQLQVTEVTRDPKADTHPALLNVWLQGTLSGDKFREGDVFEFKNLSIAPTSSDGCLVFHAGNKCASRKAFCVKEPLPGHAVHFTARSPCSDFSHLNPGDQFDFEAFILPHSNAKIVVCMEAKSSALDNLTGFVIIPTDALDTLSSVKSSQLWSFTDLELTSVCPKSKAVLAKVTDKTGSTPLKAHGRLEKLKAQFRLKRSTLEPHIAEAMSML